MPSSSVCMLSSFKRRQMHSLHTLACRWIEYWCRLEAWKVVKTHCELAGSTTPAFVRWMSISGLGGGGSRSPAGCACAWTLLGEFLVNAELMMSMPCRMSYTNLHRPLSQLHIPLQLSSVGFQIYFCKPFCYKMLVPHSANCDWINYDSMLKTTVSLMVDWPLTSNSNCSRVSQE